MIKFESQKESASQYYQQCIDSLNVYVVKKKHAVSAEYLVSTFIMVLRDIWKYYILLLTDLNS